MTARVSDFYKNLEFGEKWSFLWMKYQEAREDDFDYFYYFFNSLVMDGTYFSNERYGMDF